MKNFKYYFILFISVFIGFMLSYKILDILKINIENQALRLLYNVIFVIPIIYIMNKKIISRG